MPHYPYLIVGGGLAGDAAARGIRQLDPDGPIGLIGEEADPPYHRPSLSKGLWKGKPFERVWRKTAALGVDLHLGRKARALNLAQKEVIDDQDTTYSFDKLLLATGGSVRRLPFGGDDIIYFRTLADYQHLRQLTSEHKRFAVIGGGFIGSEMAAALRMVNQEVVMAFPEDGIGGRVFSQAMSIYLNDYYRSKGMEVLAGEWVTGVERRGETFTLKLRNAQSGVDQQLIVDAIVAGAGIQPNTQLAEAAGLKVENGILVDEQLRTGHPDVFAAGDVINFYNPALNERMRVEHEDCALTTGQMAGRNMAGDHAAYQQLPYFYSDLFDLGYEAVGELDPQAELVMRWEEVYRKGIIYYCKQNRVRGVLLWNVWEKIEEARKVIADPGPIYPADLHDWIQI